MRIRSKIEIALRKEEERHRDGLPSLRRDVADLLRSAADEIERLRKQLLTQPVK